MMEENKSLKSLNTFGLDIRAAFFMEAIHEDHLHQAFAFAEEKKLPVLVLGGGSNLLFTKSFEGLVLRVCNKGIKVIHQNDKQIVVEVMAGENWHSFVLHALSQNWYGLENLSLIPGQVGAAPMQNIGAYGVEVMSLIDAVVYWDRDAKKFIRIEGKDCKFGYRESIFKNELKNKAIIWSVEFRLSLYPSLKTNYGDIQSILSSRGISNPTPKDLSDAVVSIRQSKLPDPAEKGNAGSFFKNPVVESRIYENLIVQYPEMPSYPAGQNGYKIPAGWLIEKSGWKGKNLGTHGVHDRQALVLVNHGGATGKEIFGLACIIQADVAKKFGIQLEMEVNVI
jgi:UDP-N-acetylmuramate dehydrogenase